MISHIAGKLRQKKESSVVLDVNGIHYEVFLPGAVMKAVDAIIAPDGALKLVTYHYHHVEPSRAVPVLVGFLNEIEKEFFEKFITVSGIGPRGAVRALNVPFSQVARAIDEADTRALKSLPGIGEQRAKEIIAKDIRENRVSKLLPTIYKLPFTEVITESIVAFISPRSSNMIFVVENDSFSKTRRSVFELLWQAIP